MRERKVERRARVLMVAADKQISTELARRLREEGHICEVAEDRAHGERLLSAMAFPRRTPVFFQHVPPARARELAPSSLLPAPLGGVEPLIGEHPGVQALRRSLSQLAALEVPVTIHGENGTGKELIARELHRRSARASRPFVAVRCADLGPEALERELFGAGDGAPALEGALARAHGGTLFLDEVTKLPLALQRRLVRAMEARRVAGYQRDGVAADVRVMAGTTRNLAGRGKSKSIYRELLRHLCSAQLRVPPLRARSSDIPLLAEHFLRAFMQREQRSGLAFTPEALTCLLEHTWPGNVPELRAAVERAALASDGPIGAELLPSAGLPSDARLKLLMPGTTLAELERVAILMALDACEQSTVRAAKLLDISPRKIQYRLRQWGLERPAAEP